MDDVVSSALEEIADRKIQCEVVCLLELVLHGARLVLRGAIPQFPSRSTRTPIHPRLPLKGLVRFPRDGQETVQLRVVQLNSSARIVCGCAQLGGLLRRWKDLAGIFKLEWRCAESETGGKEVKWVINCREGQETRAMSVK